MPRVVVGVSLVSLVLCGTSLVACSDGVAPILTPVAGGAVGASRTAGLPPLAYGVHTSELPGLDTYYIDAFNDWGEVVGETGPTDSVSVAFHWQIQRGITQLFVPGTTGSGAVDVTDDGEVAVLPFYANAPYQAARWSWGGAFQLLPLVSTWSLPLPDSQPNCFPVRINIHHVILGYCQVIGLSPSVVTVWTASGRPTPVFFSGGAVLQGYPQGLSDEGIAVGRQVTTAGTEVAFVYNMNTGAYASLPVPSGAVTTGAYAVNDSGWVVGGTNIGCGHIAAWLSGRTYHDVGVCGLPTGISNDGTVVGVTEDTTTFVEYAFIWTPDSGVRRLPGVTAHDFSSQAIAINRVHQVLGTVEIAGVQHAVIWTLP
jgi:probable HAF family extracellular repeat protein